MTTEKSEPPVAPPPEVESAGRANAAPKAKAARKRTGAKKAVVTERQGKQALEARAEHVTEQDVEELIDREQEVARKVEGIPRAFERLVNQVKLFFEILRDYGSREYRRMPWYTVTMAGAALLYFLDPFDLIPDYIPGVGHVDDALVFALAVRAIKEDLRRYCTFKGYDSTRYFK